jgi:hypothetical protein
MHHYMIDCSGQSVVGIELHFQMWEPVPSQKSEKTVSL